MNPCADLSVPIGRVDEIPPPLPSRTEEDSHSDEYDISVYPDELDCIGYQDSDTEETEWQHEEPTYDDIFQEEEYIEDHFNSDEEVSDVSGSNIYYTNDDDSLYSRESYTFQPVTTTGSRLNTTTTTTRVIQLGDNSTEHR